MLIVVIEEFILVCALSAIGGLGAYLQSIRDKKTQPSFINFFTEIVLSLIVGLTLAYVGHARNWNPAIVCALALILGNNGADTISFIRQIAKNFINKKFNNEAKK